ncbi:MAG: signal peptidase I [Desulfovibrionaceae bacterium]|nr:signal peptidase I [Desulfovibrionaceae bacterium]
MIFKKKDNRLAENRKKNIFVEFAESVLWAVCLAAFLITFVVQAFKIPSGSMLETLQIGDRLLVNKFLYGIKLPFSDRYLIKGADPERGDIIVFRYPRDPSTDFIKRIVGVPGDIIEMRHKVLYLNGKILTEPYVQHLEANSFVMQRDFWGPITVPDNAYFVLGDNRDNSLDSRYWGFVEREAIRGKAWRIYWSSNGWNFRFERIGRLIE